MDEIKDIFYISLIPQRNFRMIYVAHRSRIDFTHGIAPSAITSPATDGRKEIEIEIETSSLAKRWARNEAWDGKLI